MKLPLMKTAVNRTKRQIVTFGGVNYSREAGDGELAESLNLSSEQFPCLSQRPGRKTQGNYLSPTGLYARGELVVVDGTRLLYGGNEVGTVTPGEKQFATINTKIVVFPDKVYYDTNSGEFGSLEARYPGFTGDMSFTSNTLTAASQAYIDQPGEESESVSVASGAVSITAHTGVSLNKSTGALTYTGTATKTAGDLASGNIVNLGCEDNEYMVVQRTEEQSDQSWKVYGTRHQIVLHKYPNFETVFSPGDAIEISGCTSRSANNGSHIIRSISGRTLTFDADIFTQTGVENGTVLLERKVPDLTCICECDNRIWGAEGTTIWASALGDPKNFYVYDGLSTDSYAVAVGTDGEFTGCIAYSSTVLFWKEDCVHKVLGSYPAQYEIYTYKVPGVQKGSEKSLCILNETLFYKGRNGVYAYTGGVPQLLTECFGQRRFTSAVAGTDGQRYYISMQTETGEWELYVMDISRGIWLREDNTHAADFAALDGKLYYLDAATGKVMTTGQDRSEEGRIQWSATLAPMYEPTGGSNPNTSLYSGRKNYLKLWLRCELEAGSWLKVETKTDDGPWEQVFLSHDEKARTALIPVLPVRCDKFQVRLGGKGECVLKSLVREFTIGSER